MTVKTLKSIDISSFTIISTGVATLISILVALLIFITMGALVPNSLATIALIVPTIIFGTIMVCIFTYFSIGYLYNILAKKFGFIKLDIEENYIKKISPKETALITACIAIIMILVIYFAFSLIIPVILSTMISILMYASQAIIATQLYQIMIIISNPLFIAIGILGTVIITSVFTLLATYVYNILADSDRGIKVNLSQEDKFTQLESLDPINFSIAIAAICLILNIIVGVIMIISGTPIFNALASILSSFVSGFIGALLVAVFYNFLAPKIGKLKVELE
ncbi:hypothetical protein [uncultured Methanobrevibacter sp.]|uniref:hypothetical protein n=1 Tax=uncultured Methanobrevibacter sp. TaxID=253161 RepID=UPI0025D2448D|nr:hypothetical protein [uncultured Methanobrevibacter sp.]